MTDDYITPARLKTERDWTDGLIKQFLGEPDKLATNPHYRSGPKMRLYVMARVVEAEAKAEFQAALSKKAAARAALSAASTAAANKKRADLLAAIEGLKVSVTKMPPDRLRAAAVVHYENLWAERGEYKQVSSDASQDFLHRITHNYIRHHLVKLTSVNGDERLRDELVDALKGRVGRQDGYDALWDKVADAIAEVYPDLPRVI